MSNPTMTISNDSKPASPATIATQQRAREAMPPDTAQDEEFARRGFIATAQEKSIRHADGHVIYQVGQLEWTREQAAPASVHPSLWRYVRILSHNGLFKVVDGVWQVRGFDASNMMIVSGKTGWIVIDPLMTTETAAAALKLVNEQLGERPVSAVIYGHSHPDHFGGVRAVITPGTNPPIYAPEHMVRESSSENIVAGNVMTRRAAYQFGVVLPPGPQGYVSAGIVEASAMGGTVTLIPPTIHIRETGETHVIDGVTFEFQMVPETEAPSEMNFFLPEHKVLYISENATATMHNIQTPRGALVRDANRWAWYLTEGINLWGDSAEVLVTGHCWPRFGKETIKEYIALQRDNYKFIHDQTVRRMNNGEMPLEIAANLKRPPAIEDEWSNKPYYGTVGHNAKGVFQRYIGWWDGIPAHLEMHPPVEQGKRYVRAMGGAKAVIAEAIRAMDEGDYRWAADILNHVVFADERNGDAKALLADCYEQMGYQCESGIFRNYYLVGAAELRATIPSHQIALASPDMIHSMAMDAFLDLVATRLNPEKIGERRMTVALDDGVEANRSLLTLRNCVLIGEVGKSIASPTVNVIGNRMQLVGLFVGKMPLEKVEAAGLKVEGDRAALLALLDAIEQPPVDYPIVTP